MNILNPVKHLTLAASIGLLAACGSQAPKEDMSAMSNIPDWVLNPLVENGIADTQCVTAYPGTSMGTLKSAATANARAELAKQINVKVKAMDKTYNRLTETNQGPSTGSTFESVSKQITEQSLSGSRAIKVDYVNLPPENKSNLCVMVALNPEQTKTLFENLVDGAGVNLNPNNEAVLYERFLAEKAAEEMEAEFQSRQ